jgi:hypothetical protein
VKLVHLVGFIIMNFVKLPKILRINILCGLCFIYLLKFIFFPIFRAVRIPLFETLLPKLKSINVAAMEIFEIIFDRFNADIPLIALIFLPEIVW